MGTHHHFKYSCPSAQSPLESIITCLSGHSELSYSSLILCPINSIFLCISFWILSVIYLQVQYFSHGVWSMHPIKCIFHLKCCSFHLYKFDIGHFLCLSMVKLSLPTWMCRIERDLFTVLVHQLLIWPLYWLFFLLIMGHIFLLPFMFGIFIGCQIFWVLLW